MLVKWYEFAEMQLLNSYELLLTGYGVFTKTQIPALTFLFEYKGELISKEEGESRLGVAGGGYLFFFGKSKW
jgi:hypothetical protein